MCSCETSFGSIFLFEIGASVDGAPVVVRHLENEAQPDSPVEVASSCRACAWPTESLVDSTWQSVSKITLDLPWRPARAGRQERRERER